MSRPARFMQRGGGFRVSSTASTRADGASQRLRQRVDEPTSNGTNDTSSSDILAHPSSSFQDLSLSGDPLRSSTHVMQPGIDTADYEPEAGPDNEDDDLLDDFDDQDATASSYEPPPYGLKEISSLASWTVTTAKPGCGVSALRSPSLHQFWQSDGPQPHLLSIHFFKLVSIVHMRIFLDFENDESYTPTKMQFLAGMTEGLDVQVFAEMSFEQPQGWIDVDFSQVGPIQDESDDNEGDDSEEVDAAKRINWSKRPVLRAFIVQVRILENHQNGKDTHLRALQIFARDEAAEQYARSPSKELPKKMESMHMDIDAIATPKQTNKASSSSGKVKHENNIKLASWMADPDLR